MPDVRLSSLNANLFPRMCTEPGTIRFIHSHIGLSRPNQKPIFYNFGVGPASLPFWYWAGSIRFYFSQNRVDAGRRIKFKFALGESLRVSKLSLGILLSESRFTVFIPGAVERIHKSPTAIFSQPITLTNICTALFEKETWKEKPLRLRCTKMPRIWKGKSAEMTCVHFTGILDLLWHYWTKFEAWGSPRKGSENRRLFPAANLILRPAWAGSNFVFKYSDWTSSKTEKKEEKKEKGGELVLKCRSGPVGTRKPPPKRQIREIGLSQSSGEREEEEEKGREGSTRTKILFTDRIKGEVTVTNSSFPRCDRWLRGSWVWCERCSSSRLDE